MRLKFTYLAFVLTICIACQPEEIKYTGNLTVTYGIVETVNGTPIREVVIGLFDPSIIELEFAYPRYALTTQSFALGPAKFEGINPGNYVVSVINSTYPNFKMVQIKAGQTTLVNLFEQ